MKTVTIIAVLTMVGLIGFFWNELKGAAASFASGTKPGTKKEAKMEKAPVSPEIRIKDKWEMPAVLKEISGLSHIDAQRFACVQDELGKIFIYNAKTSRIEREIPFADPGDYEGLAIVQGNAWVLRADGKLFEVRNFETQPAVKEFDTHLTVDQNAEGLCYDKQNNRLLVAIKDEEPGSPDYKGIYSFDLNTKKMPEEPIYKIDMKNEIFKQNKAARKKDQVIKPSAVSVHPGTGEIYVTDGPNGKLLVLNKSGKIERLYQLDTKEFVQPEGITFNPAGEMFISNEGSKSPGNILSLEITNR